MTDDTSLSPDEVLRRQQLERMATAANIHVRRKEYTEALNMLQQMLELDPGQHGIHRAVADIYLEQGKPGEALEHYEAALALAPGNAEYERGIATAKLRVGEAQQTRERVQELADHPEVRDVSRKRVGCASASALVFPGFGQIYNGDYVKGGILAALGMLSLLLMLWELLVGVAPVVHSKGTAPPNYPEIVLALLACVALIVLFAYGFIDAMRVARRQEGTDELTEV